MQYIRIEGLCVKFESDSCYLSALILYWHHVGDNYPGILQPFILRPH